MNNIKADIAIIGSGPGGYVSAILAAKKGKKVCLIEKDKLGGTCTNYGCIPAKAMLTSVSIMEEIENAKRVGLIVDKVELNYADVIKHRNRAVTSSRKGIELLIQKAGVNLIFGIGQIEKDKKIIVKNQQDGSDIAQVEYDKLIIATGSAPVKFSFFDIPEVWTSDDIWNIERLPSSLGIIGGGVIGCEFATFFARAGVDVTIIELMPQLVPSEDEDIAKLLFEELKKVKKINILCNSKVIECSKIENKFIVKVQIPDGTVKEFNFENILLSVGRKPVLPSGIENLAINIDKRGFIEIDEYMRTANPDVYAIGDVTGKLMLAHSASKQGEIAVEDILGKEDVKKNILKYSNIPSVIFTIPEIASVGLKEKDCNRLNIEYRIGICPFISNGKARALGISKGFVKVIVEARTHKIIGVSMIGPHVTDMIMEGVIAVDNELTVEKLSSSVHPHPTIPETIIEAALDSIGKAIHL